MYGGDLTNSLNNVERAVRRTIRSGQRLTTPGLGKPFTVVDIDHRGVVLLLGQLEARTPLTWGCLEGVAELLSHRQWVDIAGRYETTSEAGTLDEYLKKHIKRATAGWVAALLEAAGVVEIDRRRPARVRLRTDFDCDAIKV
jgi:hypothetical protein